MPPRPPPPTSIAIPGMTWSFDLPDRLKLAIADAIAIFSRIDHAIIECIWILEQADLKRKKQIAKEHAHENINFIRSVVEEHMKLDIPESWDVLVELRQERNLIAHGVWMMRFGGDTAGELAAPPTGLPMVLWHSKMLESGDFVTAESFDYWRFDKFMGRACVLLARISHTAFLDWGFDAGKHFGEVRCAQFGGRTRGKRVRCSIRHGMGVQAAERGLGRRVGAHRWRCRRVALGSTGVGGSSERPMRGREYGLVGTAGGHGELDAADADGDERADLEQLAADGAAAGVGQVGRPQGNTAQAVEQDVGH